MIPKRLEAIAAGLLLLACSAPPGGAPPSAEAPARAAPEPREREALPTILFVGTSLTAGYGLDPSQAYPALIQARVSAAGLHYRVLNAGLSGETSAGALRRIDWLLREPPAVLVLETGANDGLRGQDPAFTRRNIVAILRRVAARAPRAKRVLVGMRALPNYGADYGRRFAAVYPEVARVERVALVPFLLEGVAGVASLNQADGIHPTAAGQQRLAENVWRVLRPLL
jgi:acyl-CoA thioesterase I